jgi:8-oxo-dGTP diphosphatase
MVDTPHILARGPWPLERVTATWLQSGYEAPPEYEAAADDAIAALERRDSPSHDGLAGRLADFTQEDSGLTITLQPARWSLRLVPGDASKAMSALCIVRDEHGRWLAGRRAAWLASWPGRWSLGAGGSVDLGESPAETLGRELQEEWGVTHERLACEALLLTPGQMAVLVGQAWLAPGAEIEPDHEHDAHEWWPATIADWPAHADARLRQIAALVA